MYKLDRIDIAILEAMQDNGRITRSTLSEMVGLSQSPCHERVKRLEKAKLISRYRAEVDILQIAHVCIFYVTVKLGAHRATDFQVFERAIRRHGEIIECHALGGGIDYIMKVVANDINQYQAFMDELLDSNIGISEYFTYIVTKPIKNDTGYPISDLVNGSRSGEDAR
ncbi:Lrp/AsnC family transcriptional regulator [Pacificimonas sp. WHA3]|uniref:Lrp/AsnC family transcriptional regulator n=1 Tax=Pacificimonas pallii TaxID=2827236 RepID=A0ABS6SFD8_9SPHN|nr:Lrp/AsnC family transcriptional regulator [Pacificimonas pallii]MBV7257128.1 Lrp/AsnC family transcriptional regulator [Pacificimonas pallii]